MAKERKTINHFQYFLPAALTTKIHLILWLRPEQKESADERKRKSRRMKSVSGKKLFK